MTMDESSFEPIDEGRMFYLARCGIYSKIFGNSGFPETLFIEVRRLISTQFGIPITKITPTCSFYGDLQFDSLKHIEMIMTIEEHFGFDTNELEYDDTANMQELLKIIQSHLKEKSQTV